MNVNTPLAMILCKSLIHVSEEVCFTRCFCNAIHFACCTIAGVGIVVIHDFNELADLTHEFAFSFTDFIAMLAIQNVCLGNLWIASHQVGLHCIVDFVNAYLVLIKG